MKKYYKVETITSDQKTHDDIAFAEDDLEALDMIAEKYNVNKILDIKVVGTDENLFE